MKTLIASDLRIGNWVLWGKLFASVASIRSDYVGSGKGYKIDYVIWLDRHDERPSFCPQSQHDISPIPLTPDILIAAGFVNAYSAFHEGRSIYNLKTNPTLHFQWDSDYDAIIVSNADSDDGMMFGCKYVHQLQNIFHSLTQTELNIQL